MPPRDKQFSGSPDEWLSHAKSDFSLAKVARKQTDVLPEQVCFHAQQAAEKALKAVLLFKTIEFPYTHDIEDLIDLIGKNRIPVPSEVKEAGSLTPYAAETRYPGHDDDIASTDVDEAIRLAGCVVTWASTIVPTT